MSIVTQSNFVPLGTSKVCSLIGVSSLFVLLFFGAGCSKGPALHPVVGKVTFKGKDVGGATVIFHPKEGDPVKTPRSTGFTAEDGTFKLMTGDKAGAPAGAYKVTFLWTKEVPNKGKKGEINMNMTVETYDGFDGAYSELARSKIEVTVKAGDNKLEPFKLD